MAPQELNASAVVLCTREITFVRYEPSAAEVIDPGKWKSEESEVLFGRTQMIKILVWPVYHKSVG